MNGLVFSAPILAHDRRHPQLATVNDALAMIRSERFDPYRYTKSGNERPAWTDAVQALTTAQTTMTSETTALARSATVRLLAFAARLLDQPAQQPSGDLSIVARATSCGAPALSVQAPPIAKALHPLGPAKNGFWLGC
jgi:hypothetical protein